MRETFKQFALLLTSSRGRHTVMRHVPSAILLTGVLLVGAGRAAAGPPTPAR